MKALRPDRITNAVASFCEKLMGSAYVNQVPSPPSSPFLPSPSPPSLSPSLASLSLTLPPYFPASLPAPLFMGSLLKGLGLQRVGSPCRQLLQYERSERCRTLWRATSHVWPDIRVPTQSFTRVR